MFGPNKYDTGSRHFNGVTTHQSETTRNNFVRNHADLRYHINGGGRDTYIYNDNGGFGAMYKARDQEKPGGFLPNVNRSPEVTKKFASVYQMSKSIRYKGDGTGRDSYCMSGDGGFTNPMKQVAMDPRLAFQRSLRGYTQDQDYADRRGRRMLRKNHKRVVTHLMDQTVKLQTKNAPTRTERSSMASLQMRSAAPPMHATGKMSDSMMLDKISGLKHAGRWALSTTKNAEAAAPMIPPVTANYESKLTIQKPMPQPLRTSKAGVRQSELKMTSPIRSPLMGNVGRFESIERSDNGS